MAAAASNASLAAGLLAIRLATAAFLLVWVARKLLTPEASTGIFANFYGVPIGAEVVAALGAAQLLVVLAFAAGAFKVFSYGAVLVMHAVSTLSTWDRLLDPFTSPNALFWAAVPTLAAILALFLLRGEDQLPAVHR